MATEQDHKKQARHNQSFLDSIDREEYPDWVVTVAFYKAVHLVEMMFHRKRHHGRSHTTRNRILKRDYLSVWRDYKPLYSFSRLARYWCMKVKPEHVPYLLQRLKRVEKAINKLMK